MTISVYDLFDVVITLGEKKFFWYSVKWHWFHTVLATFYEVSLSLYSSKKSLDTLTFPSPPGTMLGAGDGEIHRQIIPLILYSNGRDDKVGECLMLAISAVIKKKVTVKGY